MINDFTAMALGVPHVSDGQLVQVGGGDGDAGCPRLVIGPGTGLGVSGLVPARSGWVPLATEGGHVDYAPTDDVEMDVLRILRRRFGRVSVERILCGEGMVSLHQALAEMAGEVPQWRTPAELTRAALEQADPAALTALHRFCEILGRVAGNAALTLGARGGVYLCGGIVPRFVDFLKSTRFREGFEDKGRMRGYMEAIPVAVVMEPYTGLLGAAEALTNPEV